jgi:hypothetical protein
MPQIPASYDLTFADNHGTTNATLRHRETGIGIVFPVDHWETATDDEKQTDVQSAVDEIFPAVMLTQGFIIEIV